MRHRALVFVGVVLSTLYAGVFGCAVDDEPYRTVAPDGSSGGTLTDVTVKPADAAEFSTALRIAHMAPRLGTIDFCYRRVGDTRAVGPVLTGAAADGGATTTDAQAGADAADAEGGPVDSGPVDSGSVDAAGPEGALLPLTVTSYIGVQGVGTFEILLVAAGAGTCVNALRTGQVTLDPGKLTTLVLMDRNAPDAGAPVDGGGDAGGGDAGAVDGGPTDAGSAPAAPGVMFVSLTDGPTAVENRARVRFVHAALGTAVQSPLRDLSASAISGKNPVLAGVVEPAHATRSQGGDPPVDVLGYAEVAPVAPLTGLRVSETGDVGFGWTSKFTDLGLTAASIHTAYVTQIDADVVVVFCNDKATVGRRTDCVTLGKL